MKDFPSEQGQGLVEYVLILLLIAIVVIIAVTAIGATTKSMFTDVNNSIDSATSMLSHFI